MSEHARAAIRIQRWLSALRENAPPEHSDYPSAYHAVQLIKHIPEDTITPEDISLIVEWLHTRKPDLDYSPHIDPELVIQSEESLTEVEKKIFGLYTAKTRGINKWWASIEAIFMADTQCRSFFKPLAAALALYPNDRDWWATCLYPKDTSFPPHYHVRCMKVAAHYFPDHPMVQQCQLLDVTLFDYLQTRPEIEITQSADFGQPSLDLIK